MFSLAILHNTARMPNPPKISSKTAISTSTLKRWHHWTHETAATALFQIEGKKAEPVVGKKVAYIKISKAGNARMACPVLSATLHTWRKVRHLHLQPMGEERKAENGRNAYSSSRRTHGMNTLDRQSTYLKHGQEFFITFKMPADDVSSRAGIIMGAEKV